MKARKPTARPAKAAAAEMPFTDALVRDFRNAGLEMQVGMFGLLACTLNAAQPLSHEELRERVQSYCATAKQRA